jgi:lysophospholipase L1-like esterase/uncharacterized membrane protein (Fun14 family)
MLARAATVVCVFGMIACAGLLVMALYRFRLGLSTDALRWYGVALGGLAIGWVLLRASPTTRVVASLIGLTIVLTLLLAERGVEIMERSSFVRMQRAVERRTGTPFDKRSVRQVVGDLRAAGTPAMPSVVPRVLLPYTGGLTSPESEFRAPFLPLAGTSLRPTVHPCVEGGRYPIYQSDEHGFLNPPKSWVRSPDLVALIGDSFTHGYCVPPDSNVAAYLREGWPRLLNLGSGGSGSLAELGTLTEYAAPLAPRLVLWMYSENDLADLAVERSNSVLPSYLERGFCQGLRHRQRAIDSAVSRWVDRIYAANAEPQMWGRYNWRQTLTLSALRNRLSQRTAVTADPMRELHLFERTLREARDRVSSWGGRLVFVYLPAWERVFDGTTASRDKTRPAVLSVTNKLGLPLVDLTPLFATHADPASLFSRGAIAPGHYSAAGYSLTARTIARAVQPLRDSVARAPVPQPQAGSTALGCGISESSTPGELP